MLKEPDFATIAEIEQYLDEVVRPQGMAGSTNSRAFGPDDHLKPLGALSTLELLNALHL